MVRPTDFQFTPRSAKYKRIPDTPTDSPTESAFRPLNLNAIPRTSAQAVHTLHEVVADHVEHDHMRIFDTSHMRMRDLNIQGGQRPHPSAIAPRECDRGAAYGVRILHRIHHVLRISGPAHRNQHVAGGGEILELLDKHAIVIDVVRIRSQ